MVLAVAMLSVSALAGCDSEAVLASGIFETEESSIKFPAGQDTNIDSLQVGNDKAFAYGSIFMRTPKATATNNLEIKKNQDSGKCGLISAAIHGSKQSDERTEYYRKP